MRLVLEQKYHLFDNLTVANQKLDERADRIVQTAGVVIGFGALASGATLAAKGLAIAGLQTALVVIGFVIFFAIIALTHYLYRPIAHQISGVSDWDKTYNDYLHSDTYFEQILSDLITAIQSSEQVNVYKSKWIPLLLGLLVLQTLSLGVAWILGLLIH